MIVCVLVYIYVNKNRCAPNTEPKKKQLFFGYEFYFLLFLSYTLALFIKYIDICEHD